MTTRGRHATAPRTILVAEDSPTQAEHLKGLLEAGGYTVTVAANGKDALAAALRDRPALVITDILMPEMDGYTLCRRIKADEALKRTPVVLVTALSAPQDIIRALECGADNVIRKPYDEQHLLSRLRYIEANRELRDGEKMQIGVEIDVAGQRHFISAERRQILDLLISAYEEAVHLNAELTTRQGDLERSSQYLEGLYRIAEGLNGATSEGEVVTAAVQLATGLPGVQAGWIVLREGETGFRLAAAAGLPPALMAPGAMDGDCLCRRRLLAGELDQVTNIRECERLQRASGDTRGLRYHASIPLWNGDRTLGVMNLAGAGPGFFSDDDLKVLHGVGNQVAVALERARLLGHLEGEVAGRTAALLAEIGERERAERTRARLTSILEATTDFVAIGHADGRIEYCNRAAREMLGIGEDEDISTIRIPDAHPEWAARLVLEEGIPAATRDGIWSGETVLRSRDGHEIPVSQLIIAHKAQEGSVEFFSTIARDISERKRAEAALRQSEKLAVMGELLAGVAHELNNPLTVIVGQTTFLRREVAGSPTEARATKIAAAAERCARIVRNFLALAGQQPPEREPVSLNTVVQEIVELLAYQLRLDNVEVAQDLDGDLPLLWADQNQLHQVVVNLVTNAQHAMRETPTPRRLSLCTRADHARATVTLEVADTGLGVPAGIQARIFEPFFTTKPPGEGTGLGLSICRGIVENHGGSIRVSSTAGQGAAFVIELPQRTPHGAAPAPGPVEAPRPRGGKTILVVDDEREVAELIAEILSLDGHSVDQAANGILALDKLAARAYDVILTDARMPGLDGPGLYRAVERRHPEMIGRFVILTGDTLSAETRAFLEATGVASLTKPFSPDDVRRAVERAAESR